jgi:tetratricopeptide (TPR) repeat protein
MLLAAGVCAASAGGEAGAFLRQDAGARGAALGGAGTAVADDAGSLLWDPAGLARLTKPEVQFTHAALFEDTAMDFAAAAVPLKRWGTLGAGYLRQSSGGFERRGTPNDAPATFSISQNALLAGWGASWALPAALRPAWVTSPKPLETGLTAVYVKESIDQASASGTGIDLGLNFKPQEAWSVALAVHNLIAPKLTYVSEPVSYPKVVDLAPAYLWQAAEGWAVLSTLRLRSVSGEGLSAAGGVELQRGKFAALRLGANADGFAAGAGLRLGNSRFDYTARIQDLGVSHLVTFTQRFGRTREEIEETIRKGISELTRSEGVRLAKAYLEKAETEVKEERIADALRDFEAAALLDPENGAIRRRIDEVSSSWDETMRRQMVARTAAQARLQFEQGNFLASRQFWKTVLEMDPAHGEAAAALSKIDQVLSRDERARLDDLRRAQSDTEVRQAMAVAQTYRERGSLRAARLEAEKASARFPGEGAILALLAQVRQEIADFSARKISESERLAGSGDYAGALKAVEAALREEPGDLKLSEKAVLLRGQIQKSVTPEERKRIEQLYYRAVEQYLRGDYATAAKLAAEVLDRDPSYDAGRVLKDKIEAAQRYAP